MGSASSKAAKTGASAVTRKYPSSTSIPKTSNPLQQQRPPPTKPGPTVHPEPSASTSKDQTIELDARDPEFGSRLSQIGPVQPMPTYSPSSTFAPSPQVTTSSSSPSATTQAPPPRQQIFPTLSSNPALVTIAAREKHARQFELESENLGRPTFPGRTLIRAEEIRKVLGLRDEGGMGGGEIERQLRLREGVVGRLGPGGLVGNP